MNIRDPYKSDIECVEPGVGSLSAAAAEAKDGDVLYLAAGTYTETAAITITGKALSIFGGGPEVSIIKCTGCNGIVADTSSVDKCITLKDFTICTTNAGTYTAIQLEGNAVASNSNKQFQIQNVSIRPFDLANDYWAKGIRLIDGWSSKIIGCHIRGKTNDLNMSSGIEMTNNTVNVQLVANQLFFIDKAINIGGTCEGIFILDCIAVYANYGVRFAPAGYEPLIKVSGCHFDCFLYGIYTTANYSQIANNMILRRTGHNFVGIFCTACDYVSITGNVLPITASANNENGIVLSNCEYCTLLGNVIIGCETDIWLQSTCTYCTAVGNTGNGTAFHIKDDGTTNSIIAASGADANFSGKVGICTEAPANPLAVNRQTDDGTVVDIEQADTVEGTISVSGNTVSYNAFMGAHFTQLKMWQKIPPIGAIVIATGEIIPCEAHIENSGKIKKGKRTAIKKRDVSGIERKEYFSYISLASERADPRVYGVYHAKMSEDARGQSFGEDNKAIHQIAALGLYKIRVTDTNGDIEDGRYIQSSIRPGEGEKQDDDILHNYTVGKAIIDVDWSDIEMDTKMGYKWKLIPATLHCG